MLRRRLQQLSCVLNAVTFSLLLSLVLAHTLVRRYLPHVSHGKENFDFFFEGEQESDDQHHPPFIIDWKVVIGTTLAFLVSCAVDVGGLAGGGLLVPVFYQVVGFGLVSLGQAVAVSRLRNIILVVWCFSLSLWTNQSIGVTMLLLWLISCKQMSRCIVQHNSHSTL